jgi:PAS domain S-box-containing protein
MAMEIDLCRVLNGLPAIMWAAPPDGHVCFIDRRWSEYTGLSFEEAGREWQAAINPDDLPQVLQLWRSIVATGEPGEMEVRLRGFDGPYRRFLVHGSPLRDDCRRTVRWCGLFTDIEDIRRADEILRRRELDFQVIVDSIPAPVAVTTPSGEVEGFDQSTARRTIRDGNRMADVIARLRVLFNKRIAAIESVDLNEAAREVIALLWIDFQRSRVVLRTELAEGLPPVSGDRVLLQQVIMNLLRNAADAMSGVEDRPRRLVIGSARGGDDHVRLSVEDAGIGFGAEDTERLFEPFYTTKSDGMGIGLSVSRSIVDSHRGRLWAASNDGPGVTFSFSIPVYMGAGPAANGLSGAREILTSSIDRAARVS